MSYWGKSLPAVLARSGTDVLQCTYVRVCVGRTSDPSAATHSNASLPLSAMADKAGDPRRPSDAVRFKRPGKDGKDEKSTDAMGIAATLLGLLGIWTRVRWFSFASLAFSLSSFVSGSRDTDVRGLMMSGVFAVMGLVLSFMPAAPQGAVNATDASISAAAGASAAT